MSPDRESRTLQAAVADARVAWVLVIIAQMQLMSVYAQRGSWLAFTCGAIVALIAAVQFVRLNWVGSAA